MPEQEPLVGVDQGALARWLAEHVPGASPDTIKIKRIPGGRSNLTYEISVDGKQVAVLRRPPLGDHPSGAHDVLREAEVIRALAGEFPVPAVLGLCRDTSIIGAPFAVLGYLQGCVIRTRDDADRLLATRESRTAAGQSMIHALAQLHTLDPALLGRPHLLDRRDYLNRQAATWHRTWQATRTRSVPEIQHGHDWLRAHAPQQRFAAILHGDFRIDNCMFTAEGQLVGVLDWELSTVGDPLADLGQLLAYWAEATDQLTILNDPPTRAEGFPARRELLDAYAALRPEGLESIAFWQIFNVWKTACILENVYARMSRGEMGTADRTPDSFGQQALAVAQHAVALIDACRR